MNYYNEIDDYAARWLQNLMDAEHIAPGYIDTRSIEDVSADDLRGFTQCHFFAGIGGWPLALELAGWPRDRPVWTGSCPCQPFSVAGKGAGFADKRHLWPVWKCLISKRKPPVIFGEQVAAATEWLGLVHGDLEGLEYAVAGIPMEAASAGAEHYRDRYWFVADDDKQCASSQRTERVGEFSGSGGDTEDHVGALANSHRERLEVGLSERSNAISQFSAVKRNGVGSLVNDPSFGWGEGWTEHEFRSRGFTAAVASIDGRQYVECPDGKWRALPPPRVRWLGNGIPARVAKLRAFGNAIVPQAAAEFIRSYDEARGLAA